MAVLAACVLVCALAAPIASADPETEAVSVEVPAPAAAPVDDGRVESSPPATTYAPDGWTQTVSAKNELQRVMAPLTTAISSREYQVGGTYNGSLSGPEEEGTPEGTLEVGYQIGCGIDMSTSNGVIMEGGAGIIPGVSPTFDATGTLPPLLPFVSAPINGVMSVGLKPGLVIVVPVIKKQFKGANPWVMISNFHVKIDGCVGQSFIRSYAVLTRVTDLSDVVLSYVGVTKSV